MVRRRADSSARHSSFYRHAWIAIAKVGLPGIYLQDLHHAGNTLTVDAGASPRELMDLTRWFRLMRDTLAQASGAEGDRWARAPPSACRRGIPA